MLQVTRASQQKGDFRNGCLQDIHRLPAFGYFPTYTLGHSTLPNCSTPSGGIYRSWMSACWSGDTVPLRRGDYPYLVTRMPTEHA
ncbi:MAG: hypothetical protein IPM37_03565 [Hahellaceae bacterium]|nr:hypothetical protein [Hahellaceae bacterium]